MFLFGMGRMKYLLGGFFGVCALLFFVYTVQADVALFFSDTYLEQGVEIPDETGTTTRIHYEHTWTDFKGVVPEGAEVNSIFLHLTWSKVVRADDEMIEPAVEGVLLPETSTTSPDTGAETSTSLDTELVPTTLPDTENESKGGGSGGSSETESSEPTIETTLPEPVVSESIEEVVEEVTTEDEPTENPPTTSEPESSEEAEERKVEEPSEEPVSPAEEQSTPSDTAGFEEVSLMRLPLLVLGDIEELVDTDSIPSEDITVSLSPQESDSGVFYCS